MSTTSGTPWRWWRAPGGHCQKRDLAEARGADDQSVRPGRPSATVAKATCAPDATLASASADVVGHLLQPVGGVGPLVVACGPRPPPRPVRGCAPRSAAPAARTWPLEGERLKHGRRGRWRRPGAGPAASRRPVRPGRPAPRSGSRSRAGAPVRTPQTAPTSATTAPMSIRWFKVVEKPDVVSVEQRLCGRPAIGMAARTWRTSPAAIAALELCAAPAEDLGAEGRLVQRGRGVRHDLALEDRAEHGDAGGDADLAEGVVGARGHAAALGLDHRDGARGQHRVDDPDPEAADDEAGQQHGPRRVGMGRRP